MTSYSKSLLSYSDVHQVFDKAGELGRVELTFDAQSKAVTWVGRANNYRVLLRRQNIALGKPETCQFDHLMIRRKKGESLVIIEPRGFDFTSAVGPDGQPISFDKKTLPGETPSVAEPDEIDALFDAYEKGKVK